MSDYISFPIFGLGGDYVTLISKEDHDRVAKHRWSVSESKKGYFYARTSIKDPITNKSKTVYLHRFILNPQNGLFVDHKNKDTLDNRRENLRPATRSRNAANSVVKGSSGGFRGVFTRDGKSFAALIRVHRKAIRLGTHSTAFEAAMAYDAAARKHHGEFASLNFPQFEIVRVTDSAPAANTNTVAATLSGQVA